MPLQKRTEFVLESNLSVMFLLTGDVGFDLLEVGLAHREIRLKALAQPRCGWMIYHHSIPRVAEAATLG